MKIYLKNLEVVFKLFANQKRLQIIKLLIKKGNLTLTDIASEIKLSIKATSKHLLYLNRGGMLISYRRANYMFYNITPGLSGYVLYFIKLISRGS